MRLKAVVGVPFLLVIPVVDTDGRSALRNVADDGDPGESADGYRRSTYVSTAPKCALATRMSAWFRCWRGKTKYAQSGGFAICCP